MDYLPLCHNTVKFSHLLLFLSFGSNALLAEAASQPAQKTIDSSKLSSQSKTQVINNWREALSAALDFNPDIHISETGIEIARDQKKQAQAEWVPTLGANASYQIRDHKNSKGRSFDTSGHTDRLDRPGQIGLDLKQNLFASGGTNARIKKGEATIQSARFDHQQTLQSVFFNLFQIILEINTSAELRAFHSSNIELSGTLLRQTKAKANVGEINKTDVYAAEAKLAESESKYEEAKARLEVALAQFEQVTGQKASTNFLWPDINLEITEDLDKLIDEASKNNYELLAIQQKEQASSREVHSQLSQQMLPVIDLTADASRTFRDTKMKSGAAKGLKDETQGTDLGAAVRLRIPLPTGSEQAVVRQAEQGLNQARLNRQKKQLEVRQTLISTYSKRRSLAKNIQRFTAELRGNEMALKAMQAEYAQGRRTFVDISEIQTRKESSYQNLMEAKKQHLIEHLRLLVLTGRLKPDTLGLGASDYTSLKTSWLGLSPKKQS